MHAGNANNVLRMSAGILAAANPCPAAARPNPTQQDGAQAGTARCSYCAASPVGTDDRTLACTAVEEQNTLRKL
jgi:hypothetical protein